MAMAPASIVGCSEDRLQRLAFELSTLAWPGNSKDSISVLFEAASPGAGVRGAIQEVIRGARNDLPPPPPTVPDEVREGVLRAYRERVDVFCPVFGFPGPPHLGKVHLDEWRRRQDAYAPPPPTGRWYWSVYRAIAKQAGYPISSDT